MTILFIIQEKKKYVESTVDSAFFKSGTIWKELILEGAIPQMGIGSMPHMKLKLTRIFLVFASLGFSIN